MVFYVSNGTGVKFIVEFCVAYGPRCGMVNGFELSLGTLANAVLKAPKKLAEIIFGPAALLPGLFAPPTLTDLTD